MQIDHVHFYVTNASDTRCWFINQLGFQPIAASTTSDTCIEVVSSGSIYCVLSSPLTPASPVARFLAHHPPGVVDVALRVEPLSPLLERAIVQGAKCLQPEAVLQEPAGQVRWSRIAAWGTLHHTLIERQGNTPLLPDCPTLAARINTSTGEKELAPDRIPNALGEEQIPPFTHVDHVVLNVATGDLNRAVDWYTRVLGFQPRQSFAIQTDYSGLCSRVMVHPTQGVQLPINEPSSATSQIQEFLDVNRGAGVQHIALHTSNIVATLAQRRRSGLALLEVPGSYYSQLRREYPMQLLGETWQAIVAQQVLVDWQAEAPEALLLQTFTQPIFQQPTFFFELIERQSCLVGGLPHRVQGFGERNFRALFEAIEQEQRKRGTL